MFPSRPTSSKAGLRAVSGLATRNRGGLFAALVLLVAHSAWPASADDTRPDSRPNILWITYEDSGTELGCYGDGYAVTPNIDRLAAQGARFTHCFTHAGVCAPSRSGIITGMYPTTLGTHNMRCRGVPPAGVKCFPEYLRAAGYYCTNNVKTDYNFDAPVTAWDESSSKAHWRNRRPGQPFFAVFNFTVSHESQIRADENRFQQNTRRLLPGERHDPAKSQLPPYFADTPATRRDWARYYDLVTAADYQIADVLAQLAEDGLADNTIVFVYGDHGRGLTRGKRWVYDSGIHVGLVVRWPGKITPGTVRDDLVAFIDLAPTVLSLAGVKIPERMQGRAFLGSQAGRPREYVFAARDRMDERYDAIRAVRDKRFKYIRNYQTQKPYAQHIAYMDEMPTIRELRRLHDESALNEVQKLFFRPTKPLEELYDTVTDPHEVHNLAARPEYRAVLERMRQVHERWMLESEDLGLLAEPYLNERMRPGGEYAATVEPTIEVASNEDGTLQVTLRCATPGASIAYALEAGPPQRWQLYSRPLRLAPDSPLKCKACRLGFKDSGTVSVRGGQLPRAGSAAATPAAEPAGADADAWREQLRRDGLLARLRQVQLAAEAADGQALLTAAADDEPAIRYRALVGLGLLPTKNDKVRAALRGALDDASAPVRIAAAQAVCAESGGEQGLDVLTAALADREMTVRLLAVQALDELDALAAPAKPALRQAMKDADTYVRNIASQALEELDAVADGPTGRQQ